MSFKEQIQHLQLVQDKVICNRLQKYVDVELTEQEIDDVLYAAKKEKFYKLEQIQKKQQYEEMMDELKRPYSAKELQTFVLKRARKEIFDENHQIVWTDETKMIFEALCYYFTNDIGFESLHERFKTIGHGWKLKKGLLLMGNVGTGKTKIMEMFTRNKRQSYIIKSCTDIASQYASAGSKVKETTAVDVLNMYSGVAPCYNTPVYFLQKELGYCFDDLGTESVKKNFGNQLNVMEDILQNRYKNTMLPYHFTHITTNLTADEIEQTYGFRVRDRMREMFNVIEFTGTSLRK